MAWDIHEVDLGVYNLTSLSSMLQPSGSQPFLILVRTAMDSVAIMILPQLGGVSAKVYHSVAMMILPQLGGVSARVYHS